MNGVIRAPRCAFAYNLLDNSDFSNPVNQRGATVYNVDTQAYTLDRWKMTSGATPISNMELNSDKSVYYIALSASYGHYIQKIEGFSRYVGKTLTFAMKCNKAPTGTDLILLINTGITQEAVKLTNGLNIVKCLIPEGATNLYVGVQNNSSDTAIAFYPEWAALYEGEYTADTLPPYVPKGYAAELAECRRYYRRYGCGLIAYYNGSQLTFSFHFDSPMKEGAIPSIALLSTSIGLFPIGSEISKNLFLRNATKVIDVVNENGVSAFVIGGTPSDGLVAGTYRYNDSIPLIELSNDL